MSRDHYRDRDRDYDRKRRSDGQYRSEIRHSPRPYEFGSFSGDRQTLRAGRALQQIASQLPAQERFDRTISFQPETQTDRIAEQIDEATLQSQQEYTPPPSNTSTSANSPVLLDASELDPIQLHNPVGAVNEFCMRQNLTHSFEEDMINGDQTNPLFSVTVVIDGERYGPGTGKRKKEAKKEACILALRYLIPAKRAKLETDTHEGSEASLGLLESGLSKQQRKRRRNQKASKEEKIVSALEDSQALQAVEKKYSYADVPLDQPTIDILFAAGAKHPSTLLSEHCQKSKMTLPEWNEGRGQVEEGGNESTRQFTAILKIAGTSFPQFSGRSKKIAREKAALFALNELVKNGKLVVNTTNLPAQGNNAEAVVKKRLEAPKFDLIRNNRFQLMVSNIYSLIADFNRADPTIVQAAKVCAGVVLFDEKSDNGWVISWGTGTIPIMECGPVQTWDGIMGGERLRTMSCSDKLLKWNVLGVQGCLLSQFMEPVYLRSIIIGALCHQGHLSRAMCCRVAQLDQHIKPTNNGTYRVNHALLVPATDQNQMQSRDIGKQSSICLNWNYADQTVEYLDGGIGLVDSKTGRESVSRLAKKNMFEKFKSFSNRLKRDDLVAPTYGESKNRCEIYRRVQKEFVDFCSQKQYGNWLCKPIEEKMFH